MKVIYKAPGCDPELRDIPNTLEELQATVGGYIETISICSDLCVICNEQGRLLGMEYNLKFLGVHFVGPIILAGVDGEEFCDLDPESCGMIMRALRLKTNL